MINKRLNSDANSKQLTLDIKRADTFSRFHKNFNPSVNGSTDTDEEGDDDVLSSNPQLTEATTSATEWLGITTNSEECSYSSEYDRSDSQLDHSENGGDYDFAPAYILNASSAGDRSTDGKLTGCRFQLKIFLFTVSCTIWHRKETKKAEMSVLDISSAIIEKVEAMPDTNDYVYIGLLFSILLSMVPPFCRLCEVG